MNLKHGGGAVDTLDRINNEGKAEVLETVLEELYPEGMDETQLNDILWFESDWCFEMCGIYEEEDEENEEEGWTDEKENAFNYFCGQFPDCKGCPYENLETVLDCQYKWEEDNAE